MISNYLPCSIQISSKENLTLKTGDIISVQVIKRVYGKKWAVGIKGRVILAYSDLDLIPGKTLRALVTREGGRFMLKLNPEFNYPIQELLAKLSLNTDYMDELTELIVTSLIRSGVGIKAKIVAQISRLLKKMKLDPKRFTRLITLLIDKKINIENPGIKDLISLLSYGQGDRRREGQRYKRKKMPESEAQIAENLKVSITAAEEGDSTLQLFNHLKGNLENWIIIPYNYSFPEDDHLYGTIRIRYDQKDKKPDQMVLLVRHESGAAWSFLLKGKKMNIFHNQTEEIPKNRFKGLQAKLQNLGVEIDDTIHKDDEFDGFSLPWEELPYKTIDTER